MSQAPVMAWLAVRELWISFRLFTVLAAFIAAGAVVALVPAPLPRTLATHAALLGTATAVTAGVAAWSLADERCSGRVAWLVSRSVSRGTVVIGWVVAIGLAVLAAITAAGVLGWLTAASVSVGLEVSGYVSRMAGVAMTSLAGVALGLAAGAAIPPAPAAALSVVACAGAITAAWMLAGDPSLVPGGAHAVLARLSEPGTAIGPGLRAAGIGLAATALLLALACVLLDRAEL